MINEELLSVVQEVYYQQKKTRDEVKKVLKERGWKEEDIKDDEINAAIIQIRNEAFRKLPVISAIYKFFDSLEEKYAHLSTRAVVVILVVAMFWLFLVAFAVYLIYDPLSVINSTRPDIPAPAVGGVEDDISFP